MKYRFFSIPANDPEPAQESLNRFCTEQQVVTVEKQFVQDADRSYWAFCVCYLDTAQGGPISTRKGKIDYREVLSEQDFALYAKLRNLRKSVAEQEGIPAYAVFTNEQLAAMVQKRVASKAALGDIEGVGAARVEKYGDAFLELLGASVEELNENANKDSSA